MNPTRAIHQAGQSLWLDNITRDLVTSGTLQRYRDELSVTGLKSNSTIFAKAIKDTAADDETVRAKLAQGSEPEDLFFDIAIEDRRTADLFGPIHERTNGLDGWVPLEVSPRLAHDFAAFNASWDELLDCVAGKCRSVAPVDDGAKR
jgi:transaldolase